MKASKFYSRGVQVSRISIEHFTGTVSEALVTWRCNKMMTDRWAVSGSFGFFCHVHQGGVIEACNMDKLDFKSVYFHNGADALGWIYIVKQVTKWAIASWLLHLWNKRQTPLFLFALSLCCCWVPQLSRGVMTALTDAAPTNMTGKYTPTELHTFWAVFLTSRFHLWGHSCWQNDCIFYWQHKCNLCC